MSPMYLLLRLDVEDDRLIEVHDVAGLPIEHRRVLRLDLIGRRRLHVVHETLVAWPAPERGDLLRIGRPAHRLERVRVALRAVRAEHEAAARGALPLGGSLSLRRRHGAHVDVVVLNQRFPFLVGRHARRRVRVGPAARPSAASTTAARAALAATCSGLSCRRRCGTRASVVGERAAPDWRRLCRRSRRCPAACASRAAAGAGPGCIQRELNRLLVVHELEPRERQRERGVLSTRGRAERRRQLGVIERRALRLRGGVDDHELIPAFDRLSVPELRRALNERRRFRKVVRRALHASRQTLGAIVGGFDVLALGGGPVGELSGDEHERERAPREVSGFHRASKGTG